MNCGCTIQGNPFDGNEKILEPCVIHAVWMGAKVKEINLQNQEHRKELDRVYDSEQSLAIKLTAAERLIGERTEKWAAAAQTIHDLKEHVGSFPLCIEEPCYSAWVATKEERRSEKRKQSSRYGWSSDPVTDAELQAKYGDSIHKPKDE